MSFHPAQLFDPIGIATKIIKITTTCEFLWREKNTPLKTSPPIRIFMHFIEKVKPKMCTLVADLKSTNQLNNCYE